MVDDSETISGIGEPFVQQMLAILLVLMLGMVAGACAGAFLCSGWMLGLLSGS